MSDGTLFYSGLVAAMALLSILYAFLPSRNHIGRKPITKPSIKSTTPLTTASDKNQHPRHLTTANPQIPDDFISKAGLPASKPFASAPTDLPTPPPSPLRTVGSQRPDIAAIITKTLHSNTMRSPLSPTPRTPFTASPIVDRTPAEIADYGDFPDYAGLSGVPLPNPYPEFIIEKALPRPYRPFRWSYRQTMAFWKMEPDWWLELESTYISRIAQRKALYATYGTSVLNALPGSDPACKELMEMSLQFLTARYPQYFDLAPNLDTFTNRILNRDFYLHTMHPLHVLLENIPEDFALMLMDPQTGMYVFRAGIICSSIGWDVGTKIGLTLAEIHEPVPDYKEKLKPSVEKFFSRLLPSSPIQRGSWGLEMGQPLFMPAGDPQESLRQTQNPDLQLSDIHLRVDWQTLRRLPLSGSIAFNFKALFTPITEFRDEPGVPQIVAKVLREGNKEIMKYKNTWHVEHMVLPALDEWAKEQSEAGVVERDAEVATLDESPWFQGWREKWRVQQGF